MNKLMLCYIVLSFYSILTVLAQTGKNCHNDSECHDQLSWECFQNVCQCKPRHIQNGVFCFPEVHYGEQCWFTDQCVDHRQICKGTDNFGAMRCSCDQYHEYNETILQCEPKKNLTGLLEEKYNSFEVISGQAKSTFYGILVCGLFITVIGCFCMIVAFFYCCRMHITYSSTFNDHQHNQTKNNQSYNRNIQSIKSAYLSLINCNNIDVTNEDTQLEKQVNKLIVKNGGKPGQSFHTSKSQSQKKRQLTDAAIDGPPIIECDMII